MQCFRERIFPFRARQSGNTKLEGEILFDLGLHVSNL